MRASLWRCVLLLTPMILVGCGHDWSVPRENEGGADAQSEGNSEAGSDAGRDADSGAGDSSADASSDAAQAGDGAVTPADAGCGAGRQSTPAGCVDRDECLEGTSACNPTATCENTDGSYECTCKPGYVGGGRLGIACMPRITVGGASGASPHFCAIDPAGRVLCWGNNAAGQLGDGTRANRATPSPISSLTNVAFVVAGDEAVCAVLADRSVQCWGDRAGKSWGEGSLTPVALGGLKDVVHLSLSATGCAVGADGGVLCWGENGNGQVGNGEVSGIPVGRPVRVSGLAPAAWVSNGRGQPISCAGLRTGAAYCWGGGLLAVSPTGSMSTSPVALPGLSDALDVVALTGRSCVRRYNKDVSCWGPTVSELGLFSVTSNASQIIGGLYHSCAVKSTGGLVCWDIGTSPADVAESSDVIVAVAQSGRTYGLTATGLLKTWTGTATATRDAGSDIKLW